MHCITFWPSNQIFYKKIQILSQCGEISNIVYESSIDNKNTIILLPNSIVLFYSSNRRGVGGFIPNTPFSKLSPEFFFQKTNHFEMNLR